MKRLAASAAVRLMPLLTGSSSNKLSVLIYHRVLPSHDPMRPDEPTVEQFDWQMRFLRDNFQPVPLLRAVEQLQSGTLPARSVCVTFDDGYADNALHALPVLRRYAVPATVFVSTGFLNGGRMWNDTIIETVRAVGERELDLRDLELGCYPLESIEQRCAAVDAIISAVKHLAPAIRAKLVAQVEQRAASLPNDLMLTDSQLRELSDNGIAIGAHTVNHPILSSVSSEVARREIQDSKRTLENLLQMDIELFAYPNGRPGTDYRQEHRELVGELGFRAAVSTHWGVGTERSDVLQLPRFTPWDKGQLKFALRMMANYRLGDSLAPSGA